MSYQQLITHGVRLHLNPPKTTAQQKRARVVGGKPISFDGPKVRSAREQIISALRPLAPPDGRPITHPVAVTLSLFFPVIGKDRSNKRKRDQLEDGYSAMHTSRPDMDNLVKMWLDGLVQVGILADDALVFKLRIAKYRNISPGVYLKINVYDDPEWENTLV